MELHPELKIYQVFHKDYVHPKRSSWIQPVGVNGYSTDGFALDSTGVNISNLNPYYCELTVMYWIWKNIRSRYVGLYHYRRYLSYLIDNALKNKEYALTIDRTQANVDYLASEAQREALLEKLEVFDLIMPRKFPHFPSIETLYTSITEREPWEIFIEEVKAYYPYEIPADKFFQLSAESTLCNMFVTHWQIFDAYCKDLFHIIDRVYKRIGPKFSDPNQNRYPGFLAERFFGYWLHIKRIRTLEVPMVIL